MQSAWIKAGHSREDVKRFKTALDALKDILESDFKKKEADRDYSPGWEQRQIAINEWNTVIESIIKLIDIKE